MFKNFKLIVEEHTNVDNGNVRHIYIYENKHTKLNISFATNDDCIYNIHFTTYTFKTKQCMSYAFKPDNYIGPAKYKDFVNSIILMHIL